jgi:hypothetical protein
MVFVASPKTTSRAPEGSVTPSVNPPVTSLVTIVPTTVVFPSGSREVMATRVASFEKVA